MGKYDILVKDAEFNLDLAKRRHKILLERLDRAIYNCDKADVKYYDVSSAVCDHEKEIRSLTMKLVWQKRKNK